MKKMITIFLLLNIAAIQFCEDIDLEKRKYLDVFTLKDYERILVADWIENFNAPGSIVNEYHFASDYTFKYISKFGTCFIQGEWKIENLDILIKPKYIKYWEKEFVLLKGGLSLPQPDRKNN